jgi:hypothetical protein
LITTVQEENGRAYAQALAAIGVVVFGVIAAVTQKRVQDEAPRRRPASGLERGRVLTRAFADMDGQKQVARTKPRYCLVLTMSRAAITPRSSMRNANGIAKTS